MKLKPLHLFFFCLFLVGVSAASVNYLWCSDTSWQLIEEEIGSHGTPLAKKHVMLEEEHLSQWLHDFIACKELFDHGIEILSADHVPVFSSPTLSIETPPPDRA